MANQLSTYLNNSYNKVIAITGGAGSGKSTFCEDFQTTYEIDSAFIGNSDFRKQLLTVKSKNLESYVDVCSMMNWWDWDSVMANIESRTELVTGICNMDSFHGKFVLVNGAILGPGCVLSLLDEIVFIYVPAETRWKRLVERDSYKRSFTELMARFMLTNFAENTYYKNLFKYYGNKIRVVNENLEFISNFDLNVFEKKNYVPYPL